MSELERYARQVADLRLAAKSESNNNWAANNIANVKDDPLGGYSFGGIQFNEENTLKFLRQLPDELKKKIPADIRKKTKGLTRAEAETVGNFFSSQMQTNPEQFKQLQADYATVLTQKVRKNASAYYGDKYENLPQNVQEFVASVGINMNWEGNHKFILKEPLKRLKAGASPEDVIGEMAMRRSIAIGRIPQVSANIRKNMVEHRTVGELKNEMKEDTLIPFEDVATSFNERIKSIIDSPQGRSKLNEILKQGNRSNASMQELDEMLKNTSTTQPAVATEPVAAEIGGAL